MSATTLTPERIQKRLSRIFAQAFPTLRAEDAAAATMENTEGWDSIATLALFSLVEEDLGVKLGYDRIADVKSFAELKELVSEKLK